ncbi:putative YigZ family protein [Antricoccus suffuscus]|uniref:Putative YigZ family protein n=1 Tax=Antricoccus suffuscus TaxID=1629062 RepID=A0A2T1A3K0_9ACTN|nr:YigZ family protein [Antricoccus suffuscus]PRZ43185.1 putative YigZ family protein [Antricoccus suffuscus]
MTVVSYHTVAADVDAEIEVKKSRFLARVRRIESEADARAVIDGCRKEFWDARHHCSAYVIGPGADLTRSNDDGEPSGTAGAPMLQTIAGRSLSDVVAVVTRYFGGTLLGAGGLVRAYSEAVAEGLDRAGVVRRTKRQVVEIRVAPAVVGKIENLVRAKGFGIVGTSYAESATLAVGIPHGRLGELRAVLAGEGEYAVTGEAWTDEPATSQ